MSIDQMGEFVVAYQVLIIFFFFIPFFLISLIFIVTIGVFRYLLIEK